MSQFSLSEKHRINLLLLWMTTLVQASIALYLPSLPNIAHNFSVPAVDIKQTITMFMLGCGISPMFYGPLSDLYGRKPILLFSLVLACIGYIVNILAYSIDIFIFARLLQGLGCGGILISGRSIVRDVFSGRELASASSYLSMGFAIGFGISPIIGGYLVHYLGWQANFIFLLLFGMIILTAILCFLPETIVHKVDKVQLKKFLYEIIVDYKLIISNLRFVKFLSGGVFAYGVVVAYNVMTPFLIQNTFAVNVTHYGYLAILMGAPYYLAASCNRNLVLKFGINTVSALGYGLIIVSGIVMLGLSLVGIPNLVYIILPMMVATFGQAFIFSNTISGALQEFPSSQGGKASAVFSSLQMLIISVLSAIMATLPDSNMLSIAIVLTVLGILAAIILPHKV